MYENVVLLLSVLFPVCAGSKGSTCKFGAECQPTARWNLTLCPFAKVSTTFELHFHDFGFSLLLTASQWHTQAYYWYCIAG